MLFRNNRFYVSEVSRSIRSRTARFPILWPLSLLGSDFHILQCYLTGELYFTFSDEN